MLIQSRGWFLAAAMLVEAAVPRALAGKAAIIDFKGLKGGDGAAFTSYHEHGYKVTARKPNTWLQSESFGDPAPYIYFVSNGGTVTDAIIVRKGGAAFSFASLDVYSSTTDIPYIFQGSLKGTKVFTVRGTVGNTFGNFAPVANPHANAAIDTLLITLTNPGGAGANPMGLDNVSVATK